MEPVSKVARAESEARSASFRAGSARVLVIGAGPAGMATVADLLARGVAVRHVDRTGETGGAYTRMHAGIQMSSQSAFIGLPGVPFVTGARYAQVGAYRAYLRRYAQVYSLAPEPMQVERIHYRGRGDLLVTMTDTSRPERDGEVEMAGGYHSVVVATGMFDHPIRPDIPGLPADGPATGGRPEVAHAAAWAGPVGVRDRRVLIVGGAASGVEIAEACAQHGARVVVSTRSGRSLLVDRRVLGIDLTPYGNSAVARLPPWIAYGACERGYTAPGLDLGFSDLRARGLIEVRGPIVRFEGRRAVFADGRAGEPFDRIVLATGYRHAHSFAPPGLARTAAGLPRTRACQSVSHPGLYFVGMPCAHNLNSAYLYGMARDSRRVAYAIARALGTERPRTERPWE